MKLVIDNAIPFIQGRFPDDLETLYLPGREITNEAVKDASGLIIRTRTRCDEALLKQTNLKLIATATIGTDHIDLCACEKAGIAVRNAPGCNAPGVAQYVLASLFKTGFDPYRDTLGIIGYGNVGRIVAEWAKQMGINSLISDDPRKEAGYEDADYLPMDEVLKRSDAVTLHVPFTKHGPFPTYRLIGETEISIMKPGAILVNSSRGGVVVESALKEALKKRSVRGVVDVWENEPYFDPELAFLAEIATPHIAGYSTQGKKRATRMVLEAVSQELGISVDLSGLECLPPKGTNMTRELIEKSYDPEVDTIALRRDPTAFESLRNTYSYRSEPLFSNNT